MKTLTVLAMLLAGCATIPYAPQSSQMWAFTEDTPTTGGHGLMLLETQESCERWRETALRQRLAPLSTFSKCRVAHIGDGSTYWVFKFHDAAVAMGSSTSYGCDQIRYQGAPAKRTDCTEMRVRLE